MLCEFEFLDHVRDLGKLQVPEAGRGNLGDSCSSIRRSATAIYSPLASKARVIPFLRDLILLLLQP